MRRDIVGAVAGVIAERLVYDSDLAPLTWDEVLALNRQGWTVYTTAPLGHVVRWEGVRLRDGDLWRAWQLARRWAGYPSRAQRSEHATGARSGSGAGEGTGAV